MALVLMLVAYRYFGSSGGGLFSQQFVDAPWTLAKMADLLKPYVTTGRARGLPEGKLRCSLAQLIGPDKPC